MVEKLKRKRTRWTPHLSRVTRLHLALGRTIPDIASVIGCHWQTVRKYIDLENLDAPMNEPARAALAETVELEKILLELQQAEPGSSQQSRLRQHLKAFHKRVEISLTDGLSKSAREKTLGEMSDGELRTYLATLVPGLESDSHPAGPEPSGPDRAVAVSVPGAGADGSETT